MRFFAVACAAFGACVVVHADAHTALIDAVRVGDREAVRTLVQQRSALSATEPDGTTALHWAVRDDDVEIVRLLLRAGANANAANRYGVTPLLLAAMTGDVTVVDELLKAGSNVNARSEGQPVILIAARNGNPAALESLLSHGADANDKEEALGETALMWAAAENHAQAVKLLIGHGADINRRSTLQHFSRDKFGDGIVTVSSVLPRGGWTALMYAARQGALDSVRALAESGADLNATAPDGATAMVLAVINAHYDVAALLAEKGADPNVPDATGTTALYAAVDMHTLAETPGRPNPRPSGTLDSVDLVKFLLEHGANPNVRLSGPAPQRNHFGIDAALGEGATPLMRAARKIDIPLLRVLIQKGADLSLETKTHTTAFMFVAGHAPERGDADATVEALKLCFASAINIDAVTDTGQTALHLAAGQGDDAAVRFLAARGAKLELKDKQGRTPLDVAMGVGARGGQAAAHQETAALLRSLIGTAAAPSPHTSNQ